MKAFFLMAIAPDTRAIEKSLPDLGKPRLLFGFNADIA
jgi:hypothetical protein